MAENKLKFEVKLEGHEGMDGAGFRAPFDVVKTFGTKARVPVRGTINGFPFRSSLSPMGGCHMMVVNKGLRESAKCKAGDVVQITLERDTEVRTVEAPLQLARELAKNKKAQERWEKMSFTNKKEMANAITGAKQEETRKRRLAKVMQVLKTGEKWTG
jgi:hypothetical protein